MTARGNTGTCAVRLIGGQNVRLIRAGAERVKAGQWVAVDLGYGAEPARVFVAPDQWITPVEPDQSARIVRLLDSAETATVAGLIERSLELLPDVKRAIGHDDDSVRITGLRLLLDGASLVVSCSGAPTGEAGDLSARISQATGVHVHLELELQTQEQAETGGGTGFPSTLDAGRKRQLVEQRIDVLRDPDARAPNGVPRLGSRVGTDQGPGRLVAVEIRHMRASVELDSGDEISLSIDELGVD